MLEDGNWVWNSKRVFGIYQVELRALPRVQLDIFDRPIQSQHEVTKVVSITASAIGQLVVDLMIALRTQQINVNDLRRSNCLYLFASCCIEHNQWSVSMTLRNTLVKLYALGRSLPELCVQRQRWLLLFKLWVFFLIWRHNLRLVCLNLAYLWVKHGGKYELLKLTWPPTGDKKALSESASIPLITSLLGAVRGMTPGDIKAQPSWSN